MTDFTGSEEPRRTDGEALDEPTPIVPGVPLAGAGAPAVVMATSSVDVDVAPEPHRHDGGASYGHEHPGGDDDDPDEAEDEGFVEGIGNTVRGLFGRDKGT